MPLGSPAGMSTCAVTAAFHQSSSLRRGRKEKRVSVPHSELPISALVPLEIRFPPEARNLDQDEEYFEVLLNGSWQRLRLHDYDALYRVPGLYETLVYRKLRCKSPERVVDLLAKVLEDWPTCMGDLRVLDFGAGNGVVAAHLRRQGVGYIVGADLLAEAERAAQRDRPGAYDRYVVGDITALPAPRWDVLNTAHLNCLVTVAALGYGDIPAEAFRVAFNLVDDCGWIAFTLKETFLGGTDETGFSGLIRGMIGSDILRVEAYHRYCHRRSIDGKKLFYVAMVGRKMRPMTDDEFVAALADDTRSIESTRAPVLGSFKARGEPSP
jgi:SAM-dependent methyltransferase